MKWAYWLACVAVCSGAAGACGGNPTVNRDDGNTLPGGSGGSDESGGSGGVGTGGADGGSGGIVIGGSGGDGGSGGATDPCELKVCPKAQHCEVVNGTAECIPNDCSDIQCPPGTQCIITPEGAICEDGCKEDVDCKPDEYCDANGDCTTDVCTPGATRCDGNSVLECLQNGSAEEEKFKCESGSPYFPSECKEENGEAHCTCEDDWDCPAFTQCDVNSCTGTGKEPTCALDPVPFENMLPKTEIVWGGTFADHNAVNSPIPESAQVVSMPLVANLDDDNSDGLIDERDFPEVIFMSYCDRNDAFRATLRAIHGGGPNKGKDYFAACANKVWHEGDALDAVTCTCDESDINGSGSMAVGDIDDDGVPEIVVATVTILDTPTGDEFHSALAIYSNTGERLAVSPNANLVEEEVPSPSPTLANLDNSGLAEVVLGGTVVTLEKDTSQQFVFVNKFDGDRPQGNAEHFKIGPVSCVANLVGDSAQEIVSGTTLYRLPAPPVGKIKQTECDGAETGEAKLWCDGKLVEVWDASTVNPGKMTEYQRRGFCAVADVLGADQTAAPGPGNPLDAVAEVITIADGTLHIFNGQDGTLRRQLTLSTAFNNEDDGGPPNIDDFDGDGFPEIGTALPSMYAVTDLQAPAPECSAWDSVDQTDPARTPPAVSCGSNADCLDDSKFACNEKTQACVCLHNGWKRLTEDDSSRATGSSVFDFNGDGAAEVVYNDECVFRIYDGTAGSVLFSDESRSRTINEYPVIADIDNDGNAEIAFVATNDYLHCKAGGNDANANNGLEVWGDPQDLWVSSRRIWSEHAYHVTNITESGRIPMFEPESWKTYNERVYNTYRSNPRSYNVAPDLTPRAVQVSSPDAKCGELSKKLDITVEVANIGDLRVGPGVVVSFYGTWGGTEVALSDAGGAPLIITLQSSLEPGDVNMITANYDSEQQQGQSGLPDSIRVFVDEGDKERECVETNNEATKEVEPGQKLPDLRVELGEPQNCPTPNLETTVINDGSAPAEDILVRYYLGDPFSGGKAFHEETIPGPLAAGDSITITATLEGFPSNRPVRIFAIVDPDNTIEECNDGNNDDATKEYSCDIG